MKKTKNSFRQFLSLILSSWYQILGIRIEEFLREIPILANKAIVCRAGVCFFKHVSRGNMGPHRQHKEERRPPTSLATKSGDRKPSTCGSHVAFVFLLYFTHVVLGGV